MRNILLELGADGGSIIIYARLINNYYFFEVETLEVWTGLKKSLTFVNLIDGWVFFKNAYPDWHQLYLVQIATQMTELVKKDYILIENKNEYTIDSWLVQLTGRGIGF